MDGRTIEFLFSSPAEAGEFASHLRAYGVEDVPAKTPDGFRFVRCEPDTPYLQGVVSFFDAKADGMERQAQVQEGEKLLLPVSSLENIVVDLEDESIHLCVEWEKTADMYRNMLPEKDRP